MRVPPDGTTEVTRSRVPNRRLPTAVVATMCGCAAVVVLLGVGVGTDFGPQLRFDTAASQALYAGDHRAKALDLLLEVLTAPGLTVVRVAVFLPVLVLLVRRRAWRTVLWVTTTIVLIGPLTTGLKDLVGRVRPDFEQGGARYDTLSFPSGHSSGIATLVTVGLVLAWPLLSGTARRWWLVAGVVLALIVGLTRIWLGVHFPSDVLGGWALGVSWTLLTALVFGALPGGRAALRRSG